MPEIPGRELQRLGQTIMQGGAQLVSSLARYRALNVNNEFENAYLQLIRGINEFNDNLDDDFETYEERWNQTSENLYETISEGIKSEDAKRRFELKYYETNDAQWQNLAKVIEARSTERALRDYTGRAYEYAQDGDMEGLMAQYNGLREYVDKVNGKPIDIWLYEMQQEAYRSQVAEELDRRWAEGGGEAALEWLVNPKSKKEFEALGKLEEEQYKDLQSEYNQRVSIKQSQANRQLEQEYESELDRFWHDFDAGQVTSYREFLQNYKVDPEKNMSIYNLFDKLAQRAKAEREKPPESDPAALLEAYRIMADSTIRPEGPGGKKELIDEMVFDGRLIPKDGYTWRERAGKYDLTQEQYAVFSMLDNGIQAMIQTAPEGKQVELMLTGTRAMESFYSMLREDKSLEDIRKNVYSMFKGPMREMLVDQGALTKPPEAMTDRETFELEKALEAPAKEGGERAIIGVGEEAEIQQRVYNIRDLEFKAFASAGLPMADALWDPKTSGWNFFDRPVPRDAGGNVDWRAMRDGNYIRYKAETVQKQIFGRELPLRYIEFYRWDADTGEWVKEAWIPLRKVPEE